MEDRDKKFADLRHKLIAGVRRLLPADSHTLAGKVWTFVRILNVRLRFIVLMVIIGVVASKWEDIMNHYDRWTRPAHADSHLATQDVEYYCGMHPNIVKKEPGNCPICGMPLIKRAKTAAKILPEGVLGQVQLTPQRMIMGRIGTSPVEYRLLARETRAFGVIDYDETRRSVITARVKGRLDKLLVNYTGQQVKQGDGLAEIYSPDLVVAQEELLTATRSQAAQKSAEGLAGDMSKSLVDFARQKLLLWGLTQQQVDEIIRQGQPQTHVTIVSPLSGIVVDKKALEGKYVMEGEELYTVADLSTVWLQAKVFESDSQGIQPGTAVEITSTAYPNEIFAGRITFVAYAVDPSTRTVSARVEVANSELKLKPGMYVIATIRLPLGKVTVLTAESTEAPATMPTAHVVKTDDLATAYLALADSIADDKSPAESIDALATQADAISPHLSAAAELATQVRQMQGKGSAEQRSAFKTVSASTIKLLQQAPPSMQLFIAHCPMADADWLAPSQEIHNPYDPAMRSCGSITGPLKAAGATDEAHFATGYYCPIYPDRLFEKPQECKLDKFPLKHARVEKVLAIPESAVIDTGTRKVAYRESAPGVFDMIEVQLGQRAGEFYPVVSGLKDSDQVATAGAFLVDAENRLNPAASAQYFGASGSPQEDKATPAPAGHQH